MKWWMVFGCIVLLLAAGMASAASTGEVTRHFEIITGSSSPASSSYDLGSLLEQCYSDVNGIWGSAPGHIKVVVVGKKSMDEVGEHVEAFSAWNRESSAIVLRQESLKNKNALKVAAEHEICHLCMNPFIADKGSKDFNWMEEGVCMVVSREPFDDTKVSKTIMNKGFLSPSDIAAAVDNSNYDISKNGYLQSYSLVKYIALRYGIDAVVQMVESPEKNFRQAFEDVTGEDFSIFYKEWEAYVRTKASTTSRISAIPVSRYHTVSRPAYAF